MASEYHWTPRQVERELTDEHLVMLLDAAQDRVALAQRQRLIELYVGVRDGYLSGRVAGGASKLKSGSTHVPAYAQPDRPATPGPRDVAAYRATLMRLATLFPGSVKVN